MLHKQCNRIVGCRCLGVKVVAVGGLQGWSLGEAGAVPCQTRPVPVDAPQGTTEHSSQGGGTSGKVCVRKGKTLPDSEEFGKKV